MDRFREIQRTVFWLKNTSIISEKQEEEQTHSHIFLIAEEGLPVCKICGLTETIDLRIDGVDFDQMRGSLQPRRYDKTRYLYNFLRRLGGYYVLEKKDVNLNNMPTQMNKIRAYLKKHKLCQKNDYYYWRLKNNVTVIVSMEDITNWCDYFRRHNHKKCSIKDFIYDRMKDIGKYNVLISLVRKKKA